MRFSVAAADSFSDPNALGSFMLMFAGWPLRMISNEMVTRAPLGTLGST